MANTASAILWPTAEQAPAVSGGDVRVAETSGWTFYTQVSVSGPSVSTTVHRAEMPRAPQATLTRDRVEVATDDFWAPVVTAAPRRDDDKQWGPWSLTQRELEVLQLLAEGATNGEISQRLYISPKTTKNHLAAIFQKLDVTNRTHALVRAVVMGLVTIE